MIALDSVHVNTKSTVSRLFGVPYNFEVRKMCKMYGIIENLCSERGIKPGKLCADLGISRGIMSDLKAGRTKRLSAENIGKVASYFGVSSDYILGVEQKEKAPAETGKRSNDSDILDEVDIAFYGDYKELTDENKETLRAMARLFRERQGKQE